VTSPASSPYREVSPERIGLRPPGHQAPDTLRLGKVTLQVGDLERSLAFYQDVIGFQLLDRADSTGQRWARLGTLDGQALLELREKPGARFAPHRRRLGIYHFAVLLPTRGDLGRFLRHALERGVHVGQSDHRYSEATYLVDPDGITIEVYRDRPREEWRVTNEGEIVSGGDPLDRAALSEAAGSEEYRGLPNGTVIGHLHFYVGDLEQAASFYHAGLGLTKVTWSWPGALFLSAGGYHHHVAINTWAAGSAPSGDDDARLLTWELVLPDESSLRATADSLRAAGYPVVAGEDGLVASDPWGITAKLVAEKGRQA
jgi:catechol 2,3-dioxygenase